MADVFGRDEAKPAAPAPAPAGAAFPPPGLTRLKLRIVTEARPDGSFESGVHAAQLSFGDGTPFPRLLQGAKVELNAADMVPTVTLTFIPGAVDVELDADVLLAYGQPRPAPGLYHALTGEVAVVRGAPPPAGPGSPFSPVEVTPEALRRMFAADGPAQAATLPGPGVDFEALRRRLAEERQAQAPPDALAREQAEADAVRRAVEAAGEIPR